MWWLLWLSISTLYMFTFQKHQQAGFSGFVIDIVRGYGFFGASAIGIVYALKGILL